MSDAESVETSSVPAAVAHDSAATEAFGLLGDETRLAVLRVLWEAHDPYGTDDAVPFSRILDRIDCDDPGNLRYHLEKLIGPFVHQRGERGGYELRTPGLQLVRTVIAGAGTSSVTREPEPVEQPCPYCGAGTLVAYREGVVVWACEDCDGVAPVATDVGGALSIVPFDPAGAAGRTPAQLKAASATALWRTAHSLFDGICPTCSGPVDGRLEHCSSHDIDGICGDCGTRHGLEARFTCRICGEYATTTPARLALLHPAVIGFYDAHGVSTRVQADDPESAARVYELVTDHDQELLATDPPRATVTATVDGDEIRVTFDETADVVDVER